MFDTADISSENFVFSLGFPVVILSEIFGRIQLVLNTTDCYTPYGANIYLSIHVRVLSLDVGFIIAILT